MTSEVRYLNSEIHTNFFYLALQPSVFSEVIDRIYARANENLFSARTEPANPKFSLKTIDLSELLQSQPRINADLHCKGDQIYCRDSQHIFILNAFDINNIQMIPIGDANAVHIQGAKACFVRDQTIEVMDLNTREIIANFPNPNLGQVRRIQGNTAYQDFDIQMTDSLLSISYYAGEINSDQPTSTALWNYKNQSRLDKIQPLTSVAIASYGSHLTDDAFYSVLGSFGQRTIQKCDLHHPDTPLKPIQSNESICSLNTFKEYLLVGNDKRLTVYNASDLTFLKWTDRILSLINVKVKNLLPFGNSILCNLEANINFKGIGAVRITDGNFANIIELVLDGEWFPALNAQICAFNTLGIGKLVVGTNDKKIHILDFLTKK